MSRLSKPIDWGKLSKTFWPANEYHAMKSDLNKQINILDEELYDNKGQFYGHNILN